MGLLKLLKSDENARKVFGKVELKIIEKQLLGVNLTQSEKNRLSRDIRKKFEFIKRIAVFSEEFELKKGAEVRKLIEEAKEIILDDTLFSKIEKIILFGSAVENKLTFKSDIDISVEFSETNRNEATFFRKRVSGRTHPRVDVQVYNILPEKIRKDIRNKGRILYKK
jgi:predicted nucleotidyltransferase